MRTVSINQNDPHRYDDLIHYDYKGSHSRKHMPLSERAAQFAPFAALTGYEEKIAETSRITETRKTLSEDEIKALNDKLTILHSCSSSHPVVTVRCFENDALKEGGSIKVHTGRLKKTDPCTGLLEFYDFKVHFEDLLEIESDCLNEY